MLLILYLHKPSKFKYNLQHDNIITSHEFSLYAPLFVLLTHAGWAKIYRLISSTACSILSVYLVLCFFLGGVSPAYALLTFTFPVTVFGLLRSMFLRIFLQYIIRFTREIHQVNRNCRTREKSYQRMFKFYTNYFKSIMYSKTPRKIHSYLLARY